MLNTDVACKVCLQKDIISTETYSPKGHFSAKQILSNILSKCASVQEHENDDLPLEMCSFCKQELLRLHRFIILVESSNQILKANQEGYHMKQEMDTGLDDNCMDIFNAEKDTPSYEDLAVNTTIKNEDGDLSDTLDTIKCEVDFTETTVQMAYGNNYGIEEMEFNENLAFVSERIKEEYIIEENRKNESNIEKKCITSNSKYAIEQFDGKNRECNICHKAFLTISGLKRHIMGHTGEKHFICEICTRPFLRKSDLKQHILTHTGEKHYTCTICVKSFSLKSNLKRHFMSHTKEELQQLDICSDMLGNLIGQEKQHVCNFCDKKYLYRVDLNRHLMFHTGEKPFSCNICVRKFVLKVDLNRHLMTHTNDKPFKCETCNKAYSLKKHLKRHMDGHKRQKDLACYICKKKFKTREGLKMHILKPSDNCRGSKTHNKISPSECDTIVNRINYNEDGKLQCEDIAFKSQLQKHITSQSRETFTCNFCRKLFPLKADLKTHLLIHTCDRPYKCEICCEEFFKYSQLQIHLKEHTGDDLLTCNFCSKMFSLKSQLEVHLSSHIEEKRFLCKMCPKKYSEITDLKRHMCTPLID